MQFCLELAELFQWHINALLLNWTIGLCNLENKDSSCLINILTIRCRNFMAKNYLKICELLQTHQTRYVVKTIGFAHFCINSSCERLDHFSFLDGAARGDFFNQWSLCCSILFAGSVGCKARDNQSLKGISHPQYLLVWPVDSFILELSWDTLSTELTLSLGSACHLSGHLSYKELNDRSTQLFHRGQITPHGQWELCQVHRRWESWLLLCLFLLLLNHNINTTN